jgi:2'-5' RNA ligase
MLFDRIEGGATMALSGGSRNCAAQDFRFAILDALFGHFERLPAYECTPHMTIDDSGSGRPGRLLAQPIVWLVEEFVLVESVHGETRHVEWGRWRLRED